MDLFQTMQHDGKEIEEMVMVLSHTGIIYYVNMCNGIVKWGYDLKIKPYQAFQKRGVHEYIDFGDDGESLCVYSSSGLKKVIIMNKEHEILVPKGIFNELRIDKGEDEWFLTHNDGERCAKAGENTFTIKRTEWSVIDKDWSLRYSIIDVLDEYKNACKVIYARTADKFAELCNQLGLCNLRDDGMMECAINEPKIIHVLYPKQVAAQTKVVDDDIISYFKGTFQRNDVFVKRSQSMKELSNVRKAYKKSHGLFSVCKLLFDESVGKYNYFAFESFEDNLTTFIKKQSLTKFSHRIKIVRKVVKALLELHANFAFHTNFAPESILVKRYAPTDRYLVKLCGMTTSTWHSESEFTNHKFHFIQRRRLARTILYIMSAGKHIFSERDHLPHSDTILYGVENDFKHAGPLATDLIMKLANSSLTLEMVLRHVLFWDPPRCLYFLRDLSDRIVLGEYGDIDNESKKAFGTSWRKNTKTFEAWFKAMENESHSQKKDKSKTGQEDEAKSPVYDTTSLKHLLRFTRNTINHSTEQTPGEDKVDLHAYIMKCYPNLLLVVYNYFIEKSQKNTGIKDTPLYRDYGPEPPLSRSE